MKPSGTYKIRYQRAQRLGAAQGAHDDPIEAMLSRVVSGERRAQRIVESLCDEIRDGGEDVTLRVRRIFSNPREVFRVELDRPDLGYQRITLLGRDALESLLELDDVRDALDLAAQSA